MEEVAEERRGGRSRGPSGPTCFDFEEVQPAKLSLRDDRDRLFVPRRISLYIPILPSFSLASTSSTSLCLPLQSTISLTRPGNHCPPLIHKYPLLGSLRIDRGIILLDIIPCPYPLPLRVTADHCSEPSLPSAFSSPSSTPPCSFLLFSFTLFFFLHFRLSFCWLISFFEFLLSFSLEYSLLFYRLLPCLP